MNRLALWIKNFVKQPVGSQFLRFFYAGFNWYAFYHVRISLPIVTVSDDDILLCISSGYFGKEIDGEFPFYLGVISTLMNENFLRRIPTNVRAIFQESHFSLILSIILKMYQN